MKRQVYIITKEGRAYSDKGLAHVAFTLRTQLGIQHDELEFNMGQAFNMPETLAKCLQRNAGACVVLSTDTNIITLPPSANARICDNLLNNQTATSWETLMAACKQSGPVD